MVAILHMLLSGTGHCIAWCMGHCSTQEWTDVNVFSAQEYEWPQSHTAHLDALPQDGAHTAVQVTNWCDRGTH
jgi:hypothetical protein